MRLIVHINGWPGIGKLAIARVLRAQLGGRLIDNHLMLNPAEALFDRDDPLFRSLREAIRATVLEHAARLPSGVPILFTDALADDAMGRAFFDDYRRLAAQRRARLVSVVLECDYDENVRRLTSAGRAEHYKLTTPAVLARMRAEAPLLRPAGIDRLDLDVSSTTAEAAASAIRQALATPPQQ